MASCKDCVHFEVCISYVREAYKRAHLASPDLNSLRSLRCDDCEHFKDRSIFIKLPDINCSVNEQFSEYVKGLFDIAKASGDPQRILQTLSECFARSAEQAEQALKLKERENSV